MNAPEHQHSHPASAAEPSDCVEFLDQIVYFIDNELDEADVAAVRQHLRSEEHTSELQSH